jgi:polyribonucleotide nucleotidyltransferase
MINEVRREIAGRTLKIETGRMAKQANGAVLVSYGDTVVLVTACVSKEPRTGTDFFPLTVEYEERLYAVGRIPGSWARREGRASEKATLSARVTDRALRPLFPDGFRNDVQIVVTVLSVEQDNPPEIAAIIGASTALCISGIPFMGPIGSVLVGYNGQELLLNPTREQAKDSILHLQIAATKEAINMVEAGAKEVSEEVMLNALAFGHDAIREIISMEEELIALTKKEPVRTTLFMVPELITKDAKALALDPMLKAASTEEKLAREEAISAVNAEAKAQLLINYPGNEKEIDEALNDVLKIVVREMILSGIRPDGRSATEVRPISVEVGVLNRTHGSGLFTRGQTQVLTIATLGALGDVQTLDGLTEEDTKRYMHHYNFPPYSVGETKPMRGPSRRDIGHGALAERALEPMLPDEETFPYTLRLVSEVLESNGSSSMASVCGSTLALMDAGVPIQAPVAGVAMGLIKEGDRIAILTDIQGMEDHLGDMDFKVAGTARGINALQMDIKISGLDMDIMKRALAQAKEGRLFILNKMLEVLPEARKEMSPYAPRIITTKIDVDKIRDVIGPGGKVIQKIIAETGVKIDVEQDGRIFISVPGLQYEMGLKALQIIEGITKDVVVGTVYLGKVTRVEKYGAFVEVLPGKEGLVHVSQLAMERVNLPEDVVSVGDEILVKVTEIDKQGRINLSRREVIKDDTSK